MPGRDAFSYAVVRVVPRVERGERFNAGVVLFARTQGGFLGARTHLDEARLAALAPGSDPAELRAHLEALERIAAGDEAAGPLASLPLLSASASWLRRRAPCSSPVRSTPACARTPPPRSSGSSARSCSRPSPRADPRRHGGRRAAIALPQRRGGGASVWQRSRAGG